MTLESLNKFFSACGLATADELQVVSQLPEELSFDSARDRDSYHGQCAHFTVQGMRFAREVEHYCSSCPTTIITAYVLRGAELPLLEHASTPTPNVRIQQVKLPFHASLAHLCLEGRVASMVLGETLFAATSDGWQRVTSRAFFSSDTAWEAFKTKLYKD